MKRLLASALVLFGLAAWGQEIGTELPAPKGTPASATPYDNPYGPNPNAPDPNAPKTDGPPSPPPVGVSDLALSAGRFSFGIRGSLTGGNTALALPLVSSATATSLARSQPGPVAPTVGLAFYVSNLIRLTLDLGFAMALPTNKEAQVGFTAAFGIEPSFRTPKAALRPFIVVQVGFGKLLSTLGSDFALLATLGGGAEYFFSPNFSVNLRMLLTMPLELTRSDLSFILFTPGLGATVYF